MRRRKLHHPKRVLPLLCIIAGLFVSSVGCTDRPEESAREVAAVVARVIEDAAKGKATEMPDEIDRLGGPEQTVKKVADYLQLQKRSVDERNMALRLVEWTFDRSAIPLLIEFARDGDPGIRSHAAHLLSDEFRGDLRATDALVTALFDQELHPSSRNYAATGLGRINDPRGPEALAKALLDPDVRDSAADALRFCVGPGAERLVLPLLTHKDKEVREAANRIVEYHPDWQATKPPKDGAEK
jgi:HEAT repeat protein